MKWFDKWKKYTNFEAVGARKNISNSEELQNDEELVYPGPINSDDILEEESNTLIDRDIEEDYSNYQIKKGLIENVDFMIVSHLVWRYLYSVYSGKDLKRYIISNTNAKNNTFVELWHKKVSLNFASFKTLN